jgi:hypothetical protein
MSTVENKRGVALDDEFPNRIESLIKSLKFFGVDVESYPGLNRGGVFKYKRGSIPNGDTLALLAKEHDVNLHWLLLGEGPMFRKQIAVEIQVEIKKVKDKLQDVQENYYNLNEEYRQFRKQQVNGHPAVPIPRTEYAPTGDTVQLLDPNSE